MTTEEAQHSFTLLMRTLRSPLVGARANSGWMRYLGSAVWPMTVEPLQATSMNTSTGLGWTNEPVFDYTNPESSNARFLVNQVDLGSPVIFVRQDGGLRAIMVRQLSSRRWILVDLTDRTAFECEVVQ